VLENVKNEMFIAFLLSFDQHLLSKKVQIYPFKCRSKPHYKGCLSTNNGFSHA